MSPYTDEQIAHFRKRTSRHINLVQECMAYVAGVYDQHQKYLLARSRIHDASKFMEPELTPYVHLTWMYKCRDEGKEYRAPKGIDTRLATFHHIKTNSHHPEHWDPTATIEVLNAQDRDKPAEAVLGHYMPVQAIIEMCCDWHAMGLERGNTARSWAEANVGVRWLFTDDQVQYLYEVLDVLEETKMITVSEDQPPPKRTGHRLERGLDPFHAEAFAGTPAEGQVDSPEPRKGGWWLMGQGDAEGFICDGQEFIVKG